MSDLKACPFCGKPFVIIKSPTGGYMLKHTVENCPIYANGKTGPVYPRKNDLIDELNARPLEDAANARAEAAEARAERLQKRLDELTALAEDMVNTINYGWNGEKLLTALAKWRGKCIAEDAIDKATNALKGGEE